jgi:hypothetical protein
LEKEIQNALLSRPNEGNNLAPEDNLNRTQTANHSSRQVLTFLHFDFTVFLSSFFSYYFY